MAENRYSLTVLKDAFAICQLPADAPFPEWASTQSPFVTISRTHEELSVICPESLVPEGVTSSRDWKCLMVHGPFGLSEIGVLSHLAAPLAEARVSIFAVSTYNTDYILVQRKDLETVVLTLSRAGNWVSRQD